MSGRMKAQRAQAADLAARFAPSCTVEVDGAPYLLRAPTLARAQRIEHEYGREMRAIDAGRDEADRERLAMEAYGRAAVVTVGECLAILDAGISSTPEDRDLVGRIILGTGGVTGSPLVHAAFRLCGMDPIVRPARGDGDGDEEAGDDPRPT